MAEQRILHAHVRGDRTAEIPRQEQRAQHGGAGNHVGRNTRQLGYPRDIVFTLGVILLSCVAAYVVPRTSVLGALLLTAYLGGAVATHVRVENPLFTHVLFPTYLAAFLWGGLILRDARLRAFLPIRRA